MRVFKTFCYLKKKKEKYWSYILMKACKKYGNTFFQSYFLRAILRRCSEKNCTGNICKIHREHR